MTLDRLLFTAAIPFEAARSVGVLPDGHRARRLHGHSFIAKVRAELPNQWAAFTGDEVDRLRARLATAVSPLDYQSLNETVQQPTDENLARWLRRRLDVPGVDTIGLQSTAHQGVDLDASEHAHLWRRYSLQSAHRLPHVPAGHQCGRMHGHGFEILLHADQDLGSKPLGTDYDLIDELWAPIDVELNHACLNDVPGLENPTSELIAAWIWNRLKPALPELSWVTVYETAQCGANYDGNRYRIWKEMTLDSSLALKRAPVDDHRRRIHGHTYTLRLHLHAPLDTVMGWTVDFGDVKTMFGPVFKRIDHQPLHELPGLEDPDSASIAQWIRREVAEDLPAVDRIDLYETRGCGVILSWGGADIALPI
jgi:6-pyruvoyltetrahydropterin/6-carboxytetrahydropterin synthase